MQKYDLAIIGAGAGGLNSAYSAAAMGKRVILIERHKPGGECTWAGCIPSKALIQIAKEVNTAQKFGMVSIDKNTVMSKVRALIEKAHQAEAVPKLQAAGIEYLSGNALFIDNSTLDVEGQIIHADHIVIATGSSPVIPNFPGLETVPFLTNEDIFQLDSLPESLIILGAGAIGVELAQAFQRLGVKVTLIDRAESILPREESEFAKSIQEILNDEGVKIYVGGSVSNVQLDGADITLDITIGKREDKIRAHSLLLALGRKPNTHTLNLADIGVEYGNEGIKVNAFCETTVAGIYAVGDVVGPYLFSHTGGYQARQLIRNLYGISAPEPISLDGVAWCTFTEPELAHCGLSEIEAKYLLGNDVAIFTAEYSDLDRAVVDQKNQGMAKVICNKQGHILGASILGERACELLCELQVLKQYNIPLQRLQETIHPYPGYSDILLHLSFDAYAHFIGNNH